MAIEGEATMTSSADVAAALTEAGTVSTRNSRCCSGRSVPCLAVPCCVSPGLAPVCVKPQVLCSVLGWAVSQGASWC